MLILNPIELTRSGITGGSEGTMRTPDPKGQVKAIVSHPTHIATAPTYHLGVGGQCVSGQISSQMLLAGASPWEVCMRYTSDPCGPWTSPAADVRLLPSF